MLSRLWVTVLTVLSVITTISNPAMILVLIDLGIRVKIVVVMVMIVMIFDLFMKKNEIFTCIYLSGID